MTFPKITTTHLVLAAFLAGLLAVPLLATISIDLYDLYYTATHFTNECAVSPFAEYASSTGSGGVLGSDSVSFDAGTSSSSGSGGALSDFPAGG